MSAELLDHLRRRNARSDGSPAPVVAFGPGASERLKAAAAAAPAAELVAVLDSEGEQQDAEAHLEGLPHRAWVSASGEAGAILDLLEAQGLRADQVTWLVGDKPGGAARAFLLAAAARGLFPRKPGVSPWRAGTEVGTELVCEFEARAYAVRPAVADDLEALRRLEEDCWRREIRSGEAELLQRISNYPEGQLALVVGGEVAGVIYSQRIDDPDHLDGLTSAQAPTLHRAGGEWVQLLALNVAGAAQSSGLGDQLLDFMLDLCLAESACRAVCAVTLCRDYDPDAGSEIATYVAQRDANGSPVDPILRFHHLHGADIRRLMPGYRPTDGRNRGHGVLIAYDLDNLAARRRAGDDPPEFRRGLDPAGVQAALSRAVAAAKPGAPALDPGQAFVDQGWDSLDLMQLRVRLGAELGATLEATLFFRFATPAALAAHLLAEQGEDEPQNEPPDPGDPVAIIGMACRFPGGVSDLESFWALLQGEVDAITPAPASRGLVPPGPEHGAIGLGGFVDDIDMFDAEFFGIAPREARHMDPQQRLLLEMAWRVMEDAGVDPEQLVGGSTGVFIGAFTHDYESLQTRRGVDTVSAYLGSGASAAMLAGRLSYCLGLRGPALTVNTACSSSLVALHLARQSLQSGECGLALVGGVSLILAPELSLAFDKAGMLAPDGRCKSFDAAADGYVRSEGCAMVLLKPLARALADGDRVWAVVRGSATNQDGASNGLTAPSEDAQVAVIRRALATANVAPADVGYVEAHGTGTPLGDPIEVRALGRAYGRGRSAGSPLMIGSVKSNIGHTEAAAGLAGVIKVALAMRHEQIPANLHFKKPNPQIRLAEIPALVVERALPWRAGPAPRRAGVSSFGFSGSNAHVILESAPVRAAVTNPCDRDQHVLALSARTGTALLQLGRQYLLRLAEDDAPIADLCASANAGRRHFRHRLAVVGDSQESIRDALLAFVEDRDSPNLFIGMFSGNDTIRDPGFALDSLSAAAARRLYATSPTYRHAFDAWGEQKSANRADALASAPPQMVGDLALAAQAGLLALVRSWGLAPDTVSVLEPTPPTGGAEEGVSAWRSLMRELGRFYAAGGAVDWRGVDVDYDRGRTPVPGYPFERQSYWFDSDPPEDAGPRRRRQLGRSETRGGSIGELIASVLERDAMSIGPATPLIQFGLDSLMALELRRRLAAQFGVEVTVRDLLTEATVASLEASAALEPRVSPAGGAPASPLAVGPIQQLWDSDPANLLSRLNDLGEHELDELLRAAGAAV